MTNKPKQQHIPPPYPLPSCSYPHPTLNDLFQYLLIYIASVDLPNVVFVALNRPQKHNAINAKMWREINQAFTTIGTTGDDTRCIILLGIGKSFCAGIDITDSKFGFTNNNNNDDDDDDTKEAADVARQAISFYPQILQMQEAFTSLEKCPVPIIAVMHGFCIGAGVDLACCTDIRYCVVPHHHDDDVNNSSKTTTFSVREVKIGLTADIGTLQRLPKLVGHNSYIKELCLTGKYFNGNDARQIGFVSGTAPNVHSTIECALEVARDVSDVSPVAVMGTKQSMNYSRDRSVEDGLVDVARFNSAALMTDDLMTSFLRNAASSSSSSEKKKKTTKKKKKENDEFKFTPLLAHSRL